MTSKYFEDEIERQIYRTTEQPVEVVRGCPFCNSDEVKVVKSVNGGYFAICPGCDSESGYYDKEAEATAAWNRREGKV